MKKVAHAACPDDCPDVCGVLITVEDGRATKIQGDPAHPMTRGFLCAKVAKYLERVYSPERVLYPMRPVAPKGAGGQLGNFARLGLAGAAAPIPSEQTFRWLSSRHLASHDPGPRRSPFPWSCWPARPTTS